MPDSKEEKILGVDAKTLAFTPKPKEEKPPDNKVDVRFGSTAPENEIRDQLARDAAAKAEKKDKK